MAGRETILEGGDDVVIQALEDDCRCTVANPCGGVAYGRRLRDRSVLGLRPRRTLESNRQL